MQNMLGQTITKVDWDPNTQKGTLSFSNGVQVNFERSDLIVPIPPRPSLVFYVCDLNSGHRWRDNFDGWCPWCPGRLSREES